MSINCFTESWGRVASLQRESPSSENPLMKNFKAKVAAVEKDIEIVLGRIAKMGATYEKYCFAVNASTLETLKRSIDSEAGKIKRESLHVKQEIEALDKENEDYGSLPDSSKDSNVYKQRRNITISLKSKIRAVVSNFIEQEQRMREDHKETVKRRVLTVMGAAADSSVIDDLVDNEMGDDVFRLAAQGSLSSALLKELEERQEGVNELKRCLIDLQEMFLDILQLVDAQGELVIVVSDDVDEAIDNNKKGNCNLFDAVIFHKGNIQLKICGVVTLSVVVIVLVLVIVVKVAT